MQLFATSPNPVVCAQALDDARLRKACLETVQILASVGLSAYKPTHLNHPVVRWVIADPANRLWTHDHALALFGEYYLRFDKPHASCAALRDVFIFPDVVGVFCNAAANASLGLDFRHLPVHNAYRAYLNARWRLDLDNGRAPKWTRRDPPAWFV